jgi:phosphoesterase family protein
MEMQSTKQRLQVDCAAFFLVLIIVGMIVTGQPANIGVRLGLRKAPAQVLIQPATPSSGGFFDHVVVILMENEGVFDICQDSPPPCSTTKAPYMAGLANNYTIGSQYLSLVPTSQPNYVALISGSMQGCISSGCPFPTGLGLGSHAPNLVDRLEAAGLTWKGYFENMTAGVGCNAALNSPEPYTPIHDPFIWFQDVTNNTSRCNKMVLANPTLNSTCTVTDCALVNDLNSGSAPNFMWLTPNDCNDMRGNSVCTGGCGVVSGTCVSSGDAYLSKIVSSILKSSAFTTARSALFITFDEGNTFCPQGTGFYPNGSQEDCVFATWAGPVAKTKFGTAHLYDHYSFTKTIEQNWNLAGFTLNDTEAIPMTEFFKSQPADFTLQRSPSFSNNQVNPTGPILVPVGSKSNVTILLSSIDNFTGTVNLAASSFPAGPSLTLSSAITLGMQGTSTPTLTFSSSTIGNYNVTVTGTSGSLSHNTTITFSVVPPDFTISATPSSLTLGLPTSTAGSSVAVNSTGDRTFFESSYLRSSFYAKGLIWLFYEDTRSTCEHETGCLMYSTSTNGSRWAPATKVPVHITDSDFSVYANGTSVFYVRYNETSFDSSCGRRIQFGLGSLSPSGTIAWLPEQTVVVGASNRAYPNDEIVVDSNGQAWVAFMSDSKMSCLGSGTQRPVVVHSVGTNYAMWTTGNTDLGNTTLSTAHSNNWHIVLVSLGNGQLYASYWIRNSDVHGKLYNGTLWGTDEQISPAAVKDDTNNWLSNSGTSISIIYFDNVTETYNFASRSSTGTWIVNLIGTAETHTGTIAFSSSYYSLPDASSYDTKDNLFDLFYMNATSQRIDQWSGSGSTWTKTTGVVSTASVPYPDSISSFIQSSPTIIGSIFYISGSTSFTINSASITFTPAGNTGAFTVTLTGKNGFSSTVNLSSSINPQTGLTAGCTPTSIPTGSGLSTCSLNASTKGNYTVTVTATNGTITHSTIVTVTVLAFPDFSITISQPAPIDVGQSSVPTITITSLNGFNGVVTLTNTIPAGLACGAITPGSITGSGSATVSCTSSLAANYTLTIAGTSGTLANNTSVTLRFQDFTISAASPITVAGSAETTTVTVRTVNGFSGTISLTNTIPMGLACGTITPNSVPGSGTATLTCTGNSAGNYTVSITGISSPLSHQASSIIQVTDFGIGSSPTIIVSSIGTNATSTITLTSVNGFSGSVSLSATVQNALILGGGAGGGRGALEMVQPSSLPNATLIPATVVVPRGGSVQCTLTIILSIGVQAGNYPVDVTATQGSLSHTAQLTLTATDFSLGSSASRLTIRAGSNSTVTLTLQSINGFNGNLTLSATVSPSGPVATFNPSMLHLTTSNSSLLTVLVPSNTPAGNYTLTVQAISGTLSHTIYITITVPLGLSTVLAELFRSNQMVTMGLISGSSAFALLAIRVATGMKRHRPKGPMRTAAWTVRTGEHRHIMTGSCLIPASSIWLSAGIPVD